MKRILAFMLSFAILSATVFSLSSCKGKKYKGDPIIPEERNEETDGSDENYSKLY